MSRVFSAMTGTATARSVPGSHPAPAVDSETDTDLELEEALAADARFVAADAGAPFVEIGGPAGPVFSAAKPKPEPRAFPRIAPAPAVPPASAPPADAPAYLSVKFHDVLARPLSRAPGAPDAGLVTLHAPEHPVAGEYRALRDEIARQLPDGTSRVLTFTAAAPESGLSTVLLNLAIALARDGQKVLALDANVTRPALAHKLGLRAAPGLAEALGGAVPLAWALQPGPVPGLQALAAGVAPDDFAPLAAALGRDLPKLLAQLRQWFDWVLVDAGVWGVVPERDSTCPAADAVYLVTRDGDAERPEFAGLRGWVKQLGGGLRGYITTRA
jgi:Mrp family chromosome partitioning ATPase